MSSRSFTVAILSVLLFSPLQTVRADVDTWLAKIAKAYGGKQQILDNRAFEQQGVTFSVMRGKEGKVTRSFRHPDHLRISIDYGQAGSELRLLAGPLSWKQNRATGEPFYSAMILQAARLGLPALLFDHKAHIKERGEYTNQAGKKLYKLELSFHKHNHISIGIEPGTGRILESTSTLRLQNFQMQFGTRYADFRKVDGRLFAFKEFHSVMGRKTGYTTLQSITIKALPDKLFYPDKLPHQKPKTLARLNSQH